LPHLSIFDSINQIAYVTDPYNYEVLYVNKYFEELLGENPVGKKCYEVFQHFKYPCDFCTNKKILKNKGKPYEWEYHNPVLNKDYLITDRIIRWYDGRYVRFEFAIDITELKQTKKQIEYQSELVDRVSDAIISTDPDFKIKSWNKAAENIYGFRAKEAIGKHMKNLADVKYIEEDRKKVLDTLFRKGYWKGETLQKRKDGKLINVYSSVNCIKDKDGNFLGVVTVNRDVTEQKKMQDALKVAEIKYRTVADNTYDFEFWLDPEENFVYVSPSCERITGYKMKDFLSNSSLRNTIVYPYDSALFLAHSQQEMKKKKPGSLEFRIIHKNGSIRWISHACQPIYDKNKNYLGVRGSNRDITEHKKDQQKINELSKFPSENPSPVFRVNKKGIILYANEASKSILDDWKCFESKKAPDKIKKQVNQILESNKSGTIEINSKNQIFLFNIVPIIKSDYVNFYGLDITDVKTAEKLIKKSEERFRLAQRAAEIGSWDWNVITGDLIWSDQIEPMFGFKKGKFGKTYEAFLDCIHPDDRQFVIDSVNACLEKDEEYDIEHRIIWPDGSVHWVRETGDVIRYKDGKPVRMLGIVQEITDRKKNEEQIKKLNESLLQYTIRLEAANKEIEAFSYSVSHDLRAPLRGIDGFSQALVEDYSDKLDETGIDYLNRVRNASQRMGQLIDGMLQLSRLSRKEMHVEEVDMGELAKSIIDKFRKEEPSRNVDFKVQDGLVTKGDKNLLQILLENILGNSWKFTSKKSNAKIEFGKTKKKNEIVFFIKDNGTGFDVKYIDKLFVPFQRLHDDEFPGDGIGLGIVSRIIRRHGGQIWAEGEVGKGAIFYFKLGGKKYE